MRVDQIHTINGLAKHFATAPAICREELLRAMTEADLLLEREIKDATPTGAHQLLRKSFFSREQVTPTGVLGIVGSPLPYAVPVELGTRPHRPPVEPLIDWARAKFGLDDQAAQSVAWAVATKISKKGTQGAFMVQNTFKRLQPTLARLFDQAAQRIVARLKAAPGAA